MIIPLVSSGPELTGLAASNRKGGFVLAKRPLLYAVSHLRKRKQEQGDLTKLTLISNEANVPEAAGRVKSTYLKQLT